MELSQASSSAKPGRAAWTNETIAILVIAVEQSKLDGDRQNDSGQFKSSCWPKIANLLKTLSNGKIVLEAKKVKSKWGQLKARYKLRKTLYNASGINKADGSIDKRVLQELYEQHNGLKEEMEKPDGFPWYDAIDRIQQGGSTPTYENQEAAEDMVKSLLSKHEARMAQKGKTGGKRPAPTAAEVSAARARLTEIEKHRESRSVVTPKAQPTRLKGGRQTPNQSVASAISSTQPSLAGAGASQGANPCPAEEGGRDESVDPGVLATGPAAGGSGWQRRGHGG